MRVLIILLVLALVSVALCDVYLHNPRGSNNRLKGNNANVDNNQRLFDSQNNDKGGYGWGPPMTYYSGSKLKIEWTAQHGCGVDNPKLECDIILQYMCHQELRDGTKSETIKLNNADEKQGEVYKYGMHEPADYFKKCKERQRNVGLFIADQEIPEDAKATRTRQEDNNKAHGFECEEERDYYPYWHPHPWKDIAILTSNGKKCDYIKKFSQNTADMHECSKPEFNNQAECEHEDNEGIWHATPGWDIPEPACIKADFSRVNHLGNGIGGQTASYDWVIPKQKRDVGSGIANCALRIRYNITTGDYPSWYPANEETDEVFIDSKFNGENSPVYQDPYVGYGKDEEKNEWHLSMALNTDQYGRTFEDRSHMFHITERPSDVAEETTIYNLNVRGKRGNIVETFPATEYDFVPNDLKIKEGDLIHFQWTGSNTNPNYAGEGRDRTDRSNIVEVVTQKNNLPSAFDQAKMFDPETAFLFAHLNQYEGKQCKNKNDKDCCKTVEQLGQNNNNADQDQQNCAKLNDPNAAYFDGGLRKLTEGIYHYMCTRNNNFSNRSQKGTIQVLADAIFGGEEGKEESNEDEGAQTGGSMKASSVAVGEGEDEGENEGEGEGANLKTIESDDESEGFDDKSQEDNENSGSHHIYHHDDHNDELPAWAVVLAVIGSLTLFVGLVMLGVAVVLVQRAQPHERI